MHSNDKAFECLRHRHTVSKKRSGTCSWDTVYIGRCINCTCSLDLTVTLTKSIDFNELFLCWNANLPFSFFWKTDTELYYNVVAQIGVLPALLFKLISFNRNWYSSKINSLRRYMKNTYNTFWYKKRGSLKSLRNILKRIRSFKMLELFQRVFCS